MTGTQRRKPVFGEWMRGIYASETNPQRDGMYVRTVRRRAGLTNSGTWYELTDGKGNFWKYPPDSTIFIDERQAAMQGQGGEAVIPSASSNCPICGVDSPHGHNMKDRWIGVDLDNTLATDGGGRLDPYTIGEPIYPMVHRVMNWVARGYEVRIFTARMCEYSYTSKQHRNVGKMQEAIGDWCLTHIGTRLEATNQKDGAMEVLWDDRAVRVLPDQGAPSFLFERSIQPPQPVRSVSEGDVRPGYVKCPTCDTQFGGYGYGVWPKVCPVCQEAAIAQEKQS